MPKRDLKKVMVIGSGPIVIGQAAEFDYAGTQACRALREEGLEVVLMNSNPATIMTDANMADKVYIEPLTLEFAEMIIAKERPCGLLPTLGGQTSLNLAKDLAESGVLDKYGVALLGTPLESIRKAEDRALFKAMLQGIDEPVPDSTIVSSVSDAVDFASSLGYPVVVRPAYTLGGTGGGIARDESELRSIAARGLKLSPISQVLVERSVEGWKEIEFEVIRDSADNCIAICSMENIDPMGIHTGDSIVVAPTLTLSDREYQMLRTASLKIIRALGVQGGCNVQLALDPQSFRYYVIEVNPRVSRSSALASKATGYPIAKVASKISIGLTLDEISNAVTGKTLACAEPTIDYVVVKFPRWPFDKFSYAVRRLGTQMTATGEVMAIGRSFESALLKAVRSLEMGSGRLEPPDATALSDAVVLERIGVPDDERIFYIAEGIRRDFALADIHKRTGVDMFFLDKIRNIVEAEKMLQGSAMVPEAIREAKKIGLSDSAIAGIIGVSEQDVRLLRLNSSISPSYKLVDTCSAEFQADTPYYYSDYEDEDEVFEMEGQKVVVLGSGPIRIGQGIEFDYCSVHSAWALRENGLKAITINCNPETVSTDFDTSDRLYFEPLVVEDVMNILAREKPLGVIVQFGGQTAINLAKPISQAGHNILGTSVEGLDIAEDRQKFDKLVESLGIPRPQGGTGHTPEQAIAIADKVGFPVLVRPSYVLGGRAMEIVYSREELASYMVRAVELAPGRPVLVDKYIPGRELEVDAVSDGETVVIPGIMEHVERAGVHSGDSIAVFPSSTIDESIERKIVDATLCLAKALGVKGLMNVQYVVDGEEVYVIEVNPRSSRTVPYLSKITGVPMVNLATKVCLGASLKDMGYSSGLWPKPGLVAVKAPVFSFSKLKGVDVCLGPEMKSTGEVMGVARDRAMAFYKATLAAGYGVPDSGAVLFSVADRDKDMAMPLMRILLNLGFRIYATAGTAKMARESGISVEELCKVGEGSPDAIELILSNRIQLVVNTMTKGKDPERVGFRIRRAAVEMGVPCLTSLETAAAVIEGLMAKVKGSRIPVIPLQEYAAMCCPDGD